MTGFIAGYYNFCLWITRFLYVHFLWIGFTILGLGVLGVMPATAAMFAVVRKWVQGDADRPIFPLFWKTYKQEFLRSNILGGILFFIGYALFIQYQILRSQEEAVYYVASFAILALAVLFIVILLYFFPVFSHFKLSNIQYLLWPFMIGFLHPVLTIVLFTAVAGIYYLVFISMPGLLFLMGGSVAAFILTWGGQITFARFERREE
ncbi:YesL family protein [Oceanobacillus neutriphilus]|uniref:DUF624 domain-containing protein n=1 Tax=Oceanobacillus neutriphilus TaxID=531815 RepID=A0ABQ2NMY1_9BACI|nr:DUF624 domain-containing protein [Oceanobacillus neutriphilus]GGP07449.1 hypothetical protein GCM10011346_03480 [Oceanobacillus neutriphilus]